MDVVSAALVVNLLSGYALTLGGAVLQGASSALEGFTQERVAAVVEAVRRRFAGDPGAADAVDRLENAPGDQRRQGAVEERLEEAMVADPAFAEMLTRLVEAARAPVTSTVAVHDAGAVAVGGSVAISAGGHAAGRDLRIERAERL